MKLTTTKVSVPVLMMLLAQSGYGTDWFVNVLGMLHNKESKAQIVQYVQNHAPADAMQVPDSVKAGLVEDWETEIKDLIGEYVPYYLTGQSEETADLNSDFIDAVYDAFTNLEAPVDADAVESAWVRKIVGDFGDQEITDWWRQDTDLAGAVPAWKDDVTTKWAGSAVPTVEALNDSVTAFIEGYSDNDATNKSLLKTTILTKENYLDALQDPVDSEDTPTYDAVNGAVDIAEVKADIRGALANRADAVRLDAVYGDGFIDAPDEGQFDESLPDKIVKAVNEEAQKETPDLQKAALTTLQTDDAEDVITELTKQTPDLFDVRAELTEFLADYYYSGVVDDDTDYNAEDHGEWNSEDHASDAMAKIIANLQGQDNPAIGGLNTPDEKLLAVTKACNEVFDSLLYNVAPAEENKNARLTALQEALDKAYTDYPRSETEEESLRKSRITSIIATLNAGAYPVQYWDAGTDGVNISKVRNVLNAIADSTAGNPDADVIGEAKGYVKNLFPSALSSDDEKDGLLEGETGLWPKLINTAQLYGADYGTMKTPIQEAIVGYFYDHAWRLDQDTKDGIDEWKGNIATVWARSEVPAEVTGDFNTSVSQFIAGYSVPGAEATEEEITEINTANQELLKTKILTPENHLDALQDPAPTTEVPEPATPTYDKVSAVFGEMEAAPKDAIHEALIDRATAVRTDVLTNGGVGIVDPEDVGPEAEIEEINNIIASNDDPIATNSLEDALVHKVAIENVGDATTALEKYLKFYRQRVASDAPEDAGVEEIKEKISEVINESLGSEDESGEETSIVDIVQNAIDSVIGDKMQSFLRKDIDQNNETLINAVDNTEWPIVSDSEIETDAGTEAEAVYIGNYVQEIEDADANKIADDVNSIEKNGGLIPPNS